MNHDQIRAHKSQSRKEVGLDLDVGNVSQRPLMENGRLDGRRAMTEDGSAARSSICRRLRTLAFSL